MNGCETNEDLTDANNLDGVIAKNYKCRNEVQKKLSHSTLIDIIPKKNFIELRVHDRLKLHNKTVIEFPGAQFGSYMHDCISYILKEEYMVNTSKCTPLMIWEPSPTFQKLGLGGYRDNDDMMDKTICYDFRKIVVGGFRSKFKKVVVSPVLISDEMGMYGYGDLLCDGMVVDIKCYLSGANILGWNNYLQLLIYSAIYGCNETMCIYDPLKGVFHMMKLGGNDLVLLKQNINDVVESLCSQQKQEKVESKF